MQVPVRRLPLVTNNPLLPTISPEDLSLVVPYENSALAHWVFGGDDDCLLSKVSSHVLTKSGTVSYTDHAAVLKGLSGYLQSDILDLHDMTAITVFKRPVADGTNDFALIGNFTSGTLSGFSHFLNDSGNISGAMAMTTGGANSLTAAVPAGIVAGDWLAAATILNFADGAKRYAVAAGGAYFEDDLSAFDGPNVTNATIGLRIGYANTNTGFSTNDREIAETIIFDRALSRDELFEVEYRAQIRQAAKGQDIQFA